jgi:MutS domain V
LGDYDDPAVVVGFFLRAQSLPDYGVLILAQRAEGADSVGFDPRAEYQRRLEISRGLASELARRDDLAGNARLGVFVVGVILAVLAWRGSVGVGWPIAVLVIFVILVLVHSRILAARRRAEGKAAYHDRGLARLDDQWAGTGVAGERFLDEEHPYSADLDLFGKGSLFERLCTARTSSGEATLADWLLRPAPLVEIKARQQAISELLPNLDFREDLALLGDDVRSGVAPETLAAWGSTPQRRAPLWIRGLLALLGLATLVALVGWLAAGWSTFPFLGLILVEVIVSALLARRVGRALADVEARSGELETLSGLLARIERESFESPRLRELKAAIESGGTPASSRIARLAGLVLWLEARHNVYFALFGSMLLWKTQFGLAIEAWREAEGTSIGQWLEVVGKVEAYCSLASFSFENPADPFPELVEIEDGPVLEGEELGHPLLPSKHCVRNDLKLGGELRVLSVSGSNMSGKSTWLRTVGVNAVLAQAGATVRAGRLKLSPLAIGGTLRVHDSLQAGRSRFYAEILRLKQLVETSKESPPLLFLIDEVLHGTNSHDRLQGAEAVIRGLIDRGAIGLFTTHDLALAEVAGRLAPRALNVHFADYLDDKGQLAFDYKMRPGVVHQSNALALMRAVGLDV